MLIKINDTADNCELRIEAQPDDIEVSVYAVNSEGTETLVNVNLEELKAAVLAVESLLKSKKS